MSDSNNLIDLAEDFELFCKRHGYKIEELYSLHYKLSMKSDDASRQHFLWLDKYIDNWERISDQENETK